MNTETGSLDLLNFIRKDVPAIVLERFFTDRLSRDNHEFAREFFEKVNRMDEEGKKAILERLTNLKEKVERGLKQETGFVAFANPAYLIKELREIGREVHQQTPLDSLQSLSEALEANEPKQEHQE